MLTVIASGESSSTATTDANATETRTADSRLFDPIRDIQSGLVLHSMLTRAVELRVS
jgi:hypothetical protein